MPRLVIFDKLPKGEHTWYEDAETGATVDVMPGDKVPARKIVDPEHYVRLRVARIVGVEDGTDGRLDLLMTKLRSAFAEIAPLGGAPTTWSLDAMTAKAKEIESEDAAAREAFAAAEAAVPQTVEEIHAADGASV